MTRACSRSPGIGTCDMQEGVHTIGEFVVAGREAAKLLETIEESLDEVARLVSMPVNRSQRVAVAARGMMASAPAALMVATSASLS